jgi:hypothetical protein
MDDMFMGPATVAAGLTAIQLHNSGPAPHQLQLLRLDDGVTAEQAIAATRSPDPGALLRLASPAGGANAIASGAEQDVTVDLQPGTYLEVCFVPDPDGVPHLAKGMVSTLAVTGEDAPATAPATVGKVALHDFRFDLPVPFQGTGEALGLSPAFVGISLSFSFDNGGTSRPRIDSPAFSPLPAEFACVSV